MALAGIPNADLAFARRAIPAAPASAAPEGGGGCLSTVVLLLVLAAFAATAVYLYHKAKQAFAKLNAVQRATEAAISSAAAAEVAAVRSAAAFESLSRSACTFDSAPAAAVREGVKTLQKRVDALEVRASVETGGGLRLETDAHPPAAKPAD